MPPPTLASNATSTPRARRGAEDLLAVQREQRLVRGDDVLAAPRSRAGSAGARRSCRRSARSRSSTSGSAISASASRVEADARRGRRRDRAREIEVGDRARGAAESRAAARSPRRCAAAPSRRRCRSCRGRSGRRRRRAADAGYSARLAQEAAGCRAPPGGCGARSRPARSARSPRRSGRSRARRHRDLRLARAGACENSSEPSARNGSGICAQTNIVPSGFSIFHAPSPGCAEPVDQRVAPLAVDRRSSRPRSPAGRAAPRSRRSGSACGMP